MKQRLKALRLAHSLTQTEVAEFISCDQSLYSKYEREERALPLDLAISLADYYGITLDYLVGRTDTPAE
nr:helix-turn-helix transcriptional regulator [Clostridia bacterium]